ncbi:hypothetical protein AKJ38_01720 [candidate division MSBL1 archaeon SCGC-AAA259I14]|uniref:DUF1232 domain-containing protein n=1 Tax=candidate division MSBL1 archaeon SCGC-AAA259I14 TaxID=1698268 RepID=A0A133USQ8_9EURY|nr:hypothetical protein AKJ38_01720 [candidate division MSBL1 archaeon SCGC-AAA259I14]
MTRVYRFAGSKALIERNEKGFVANCKCGWDSGVKDSREEAIVAFETHVSSDPRHKVMEETRGLNFFSIFLAVMGILYVISPYDIVPDYMIGVGWFEDIIILLLSIILIKGGIEGKSPGQIISSISP